MDTGIKWLVGLLLASVLLSGIGFSYKWVYDKGIEHQQNVDIITLEKANKEAKDKYDKLSQELIDERNKSKVVYRTITKEVEKIVDRPIYRNDCWDNDGLLQYNNALTGTNPGGATPALPSSDSTNR